MVEHHTHTHTHVGPLPQTHTHVGPHTHGSAPLKMNRAMTEDMTGRALKKIAHELQGAASVIIASRVALHYARLVTPVIRADLLLKKRRSARADR